MCARHTCVCVWCTCLWARVCMPLHAGARVVCVGGRGGKIREDTCASQGRHPRKHQGGVPSTRHLSAQPRSTRCLQLQVTCFPDTKCAQEGDSQRMVGTCLCPGPRAGAQAFEGVIPGCHKATPSLPSGAGLLSLHTAGTSGLVILCCGAVLCVQDVWGHPWPLDAGGTLSPVITTRSAPRHGQVSSGAELALAETD